MLLSLALAGCVGTATAHDIDDSLTEGRAVSSIVGSASYYGGFHHGRRTANGERFNKNALTAAHRSWRFGTRVRVTNLSNNRSVVVRITDRGPFIGGRIIDLSQGAASAIGMIASGVGRVRLDKLN